MHSKKVEATLRSNGAPDTSMRTSRLMNTANLLDRRVDRDRRVVPFGSAFERLLGNSEKCSRVGLRVRFSLPDTASNPEVLQQRMHARHLPSKTRQMYAMRLGELRFCVRNENGQNGQYVQTVHLRFRMHKRTGRDPH